MSKTGYILKYVTRCLVLKEQSKTREDSSIPKSLDGEAKVKNQNTIGEVIF